MLKENEERLVGLAATEMPLLLAVNLLHKVAKQADCELLYEEAGVISKLLGKRDAELLKLLMRKRVDEKAINVVDEFLTGDRNQRTMQSDVKVWLHLSEIGRRILDHLLV